MAPLEGQVMVGGLLLLLRVVVVFLRGSVCWELGPVAVS